MIARLSRDFYFGWNSELYRIVYTNDFETQKNLSHNQRLLFFGVNYFEVFLAKLKNIPKINFVKFIFVTFGCVYSVYIKEINRKQTTCHQV